jgi:midasin (ATPase involved in ribosome maturation)
MNYGLGSLHKLMYFLKTRYALRIFSLIAKDIDSLRDLVSLWFDMAQLLNDEDLDPSYYIAFRNLLEGWTARATGPALSGFVNQVRSQLKSLSNTVALSTGVSMPLIWKMARPNVPSSLEQWEAYHELITVMKNFESRVALQDRKFP